MKKRINIMVLLIIMSVMLAACGSSGDKNSGQGTEVSGDVITVNTDDGKDLVSVDMTGAGEAIRHSASVTPDMEEQTERSSTEAAAEAEAETESVSDDKAAKINSKDTVSADTVQNAVTAEQTDTAAAQTSKPAPAAGGGRIVCIDAGHQSHADTSKEPIGPGASETKAKVAGGTTGVSTGVPEYQLTLAVALKLQSELAARGYTVIMCRTSNDVNISNSARAQVANNAGAGAFIRIHANGSTSSGASGALTMAPSSSNPYCASIAVQSQSLARNVISSFCAKTGAANKGVSITDTMSGINWCQVPVTIIELGFMTNPAEDAQMENDSYQTLMAQGIADGIDAYFASK